MTTSEERAGGTTARIDPAGWTWTSTRLPRTCGRSRASSVPDTRICAVVKAEAYGLGAVEVARAALAAGAERLAVARVDEAIQLRRAGIRAPILLIAGFVPAEADVIVSNGITATVVQARDGLALARAAGRLGTVVDVHVKIDTGLTRYGAPPAEAPALVRLLRSLPTVNLEGLYSHFASADEADQQYVAAAPAGRLGSVGLLQLGAQDRGQSSLTLTLER